jgi:hypothetical protein
MPRVSFFRVIISILAVVVFVAIAYLLWKIPLWYFANSESILQPQDLFKLQNEMRASLAQGLGAIVLIIGLLFTWRNLRITQETSEKNRVIAQEGQLTERFSKAIEQLGRDNMAIRLGGIYALERIARDSEKDYWPIIEVLTSYVREKAPCSDYQSVQENQEGSTKLSKPPADIQAILTIIGRRKKSFGNGENQSIDLHGTDLRGIILVGAHLEYADLSGANLEAANCQEAILTSINLKRAYLKKAVFSYARLDKADLSFSNLESAELLHAHLQGANLQESILVEASLDEANLELADLRKPT